MNLDIERLIDTIVGFVLGVVFAIIVTLAIDYFMPPHQCVSKVAYTLHNVVRTSDGYWRSEIHRYGEPHGVIYSQEPIEVGFVVDERRLK